MELGQPPVLPQPPATPIEASAEGRVTVHRYSLGEQEVVVRTSGNVTVAGDSTLDIPSDARVDVEIRSHGQRTTIVLDSSGCTVYRGAMATACDATERELVVASVKHQPIPPVPPHLDR